jgi:hypothetical protein
MRVREIGAGDVLRHREVGAEGAEGRIRIRELGRYRIPDRAGL